MKKISAVAAVVGVLIAPSLSIAAVRVAKDGYLPQWNAPRLVDTSAVTMVYVKDEKALMVAFNERGGKIAGSVEGALDVNPQPTRKVHAFSVISIKDKKCTIYTTDPAKLYQPEYIGHELMHCFHGQWHG